MDREIEKRLDLLAKRIESAAKRNGRINLSVAETKALFEQRFLASDLGMPLKLYIFRRMAGGETEKSFTSDAEAAAHAKLLVEQGAEAVTWYQFLGHLGEEIF